MMTMDLFHLVNAFMNRNKVTEENHELTVPIEAAEDTRVLPGSSASCLKEKVKNGNLFSSLEPFQHLLPDLCGMEMSQQKKLHKALYSAGVSAALSLQKFVSEVPRKKIKDSDEVSPEDFNVKEIIEHLNRSVAFEDAAKTFRLMSSNMDEIMQKMDGGKMLMTMISNEVAAAALAAFASATLRKPPTKHVESLMQSSQEIGTQLLDDEDMPDSESTPELKRSASLGKADGAERDGSNNAKRPSSCTRHNKINNTTASAGFGAKKSRYSSATRSSTSSIVAVAELEDGNENEEDCMCDTEEEMDGEEDNLFRYVCAAGYEDLAKLLLSMRNSAEFVQHSDSTPLMEACCGGHPDVVKTLIQAGADVNALSSTRNTALIYACASGHTECVKELLKTSDCDLNIRNESGHCALMEAANIGNVGIMKLLVKSGASASCVVESVDYKESALTLASYKGHYEAVEYLLSIMTKEKNSQEEEELHTALMESAMDGHVDVAKLLLDAGAKVNLSSESFENPLTLASCGGHTEMVKLLIDAGADLEEPNDEGYTPLMEASREGHYEVVELLLNRGANVNAKIEDGLETSLTLAASGGFRNVIELLVSRGGDLQVGERTPLYESCQESHLEVAQLIVQHLRNNYSLQEIQKDLNEALFCSAGIDNVQLCDLLIKNGAQIDCFKDNRTPLMEAARQNCLNVAELLIKKGADVNKIAPCPVGKDVDVGAPKSKSSKRLQKNDCCPTLKCPCCVPPSLKKSAKEVCTAAGIPAPFSTGQNVGPSTGAKKTAPSRSSTPQQKCPAPPKTKASGVNMKTQRSLSSSTATTLSDPWLDTAPSDSQNNNDTALTLACVGGQTGIVSLLIKNGAHIEHRDKKGFTPLILAATGGHTETCKLLIETGAQVDAQAERTKDTALSLACSGGRKEVVELLLKHNSNKEHRNLSDYTPLSLAASGGYVDIIQLLLNNAAEINSRTNSKLGISPLMLSAMNGHLDATRMLLVKGSDINAQIETNKNTALTLACFQGRAEVVKLLIEFGANVEHRAKTGLTPLMEAANGGYFDVGMALLEAGADVNSSPVPTSRDTALTIAADKGHHEFVELLLHQNAAINARNKKGCTPLWLACCGGHLEAAKVLITHKADVDAQDNRKLTALMIAFRRGHTHLVNYLVDHATQFPSDQDCHRFIATVTDQDLIAKCRQSVQYIMNAKAKQTEQANRAAESLLEMLAMEEALEESKKRTKQRQKEKKKAKKQAKKEIPSPEDLQVLVVEEMERPNPEEKVVQIAKVEKTNKRQNESIQNCVKAPPNAATSQQLTKAGVESGTGKKVVTTTASSEAEEEWLRASKKRASINKQTEALKAGQNGSTKSNASNANGTMSSQQTTPLAVSFDDLAAELALNVGRRQSIQVLSIAGNQIPRVIGRAGANVNTIREATGAHVEVEKQSLRKEQPIRKITLKGPSEAVRNAMKMIDLLLKDHNLVIGEIVERVLALQRKSPTLSTSSDTSQISQARPLPLKTPPLCSASVPSSPVVANVKQLSVCALRQSDDQKLSSEAESSERIGVLSANAQDAKTQINGGSKRTDNVWQKRAEAIREKKTSPSERVLSKPISPPNNAPTTNERVSPPHSQGDSHGESTTTTNGEMAAFTNEEHQRKAPGYGAALRPHSSASVNAQPTSVVDKMDDSMAVSLFDVFASRWNANPLDTEAENDVTLMNDDGVNIQNSWSYLLNKNGPTETQRDERKHETEPPQQQQPILDTQSASSGIDGATAPNFQQSRPAGWPLSGTFSQQPPIGNEISGVPVPTHPLASTQHSQQHPNLQIPSPHPISGNLTLYQELQQPPLQQQYPSANNFHTVPPSPFSGSANGAPNYGLINAALAASAAISSQQQQQGPHQQQHNIHQGTFYQQQHQQAKLMSFAQIGQYNAQNTTATTHSTLPTFPSMYSNHPPLSFGQQQVTSNARGLQQGAFVLSGVGRSNSSAAPSPNIANSPVDPSLVANPSSRFDFRRQF